MTEPALSCADTCPAALQLPISFKDAHFRTGAYYLPSRFRGRSIPIMVIFHGFMGTGLVMLHPFTRMRPGSMGGCQYLCRDLRLSVIMP